MAFYLWFCKWNAVKFLQWALIVRKHHNCLFISLTISCNTFFFYSKCVCWSLLFIMYLTSSKDYRKMIFWIHIVTTLFNFIFQADSPQETKLWVQYLRQQMKNLGCWRKRRNALPNILLNHIQWKDNCNDQWTDTVS